MITARHATMHETTRAAPAMSRTHRLGLAGGILALAVFSCSPAIVSASSQVRAALTARREAPRETAPQPKAPAGLPPNPIRAEEPPPPPPAQPPAPPAQAPPPAPPIGPVRPELPRIRVDGIDPARGDAVAAALEVDGVSHVAEAQIGDVVFQPEGRPAVNVAVAAVDLLGFRVFTPPRTAAHVPLWERLLAGDVAFTHEAGQQLGFALGSHVRAGVSVQPLRVGAYASNSTPPIAQAIVSVEAGRRLGVSGQRVLLASVDHTVALTRVAARLERRLGVPARVLEDPRVPHRVIVPRGELSWENVWDYLAQCESSGYWHINTGNGYYGGLQFLPESWQLVGGSGLPHEASRDEQIYRAILLHRIQGWEAWPTCSRLLGLR